MSDIRRRLNRLQVIYAAKGCPTCASWDTTVVQIVTRDASPSDEDRLVNLPRPDRCPSCGRRSPDRTAVVQIVAPDDDEPEYMADA